LGPCTMPAASMSTSATYASCFLLGRPPPFSTLFPYTTLFRSVRGDDAGAADADERRKRQSFFVGASNHVLQDVSQPLDGILAPRDRKSTRVNPSHVATSYAVGHFESIFQMELHDAGADTAAAD